MVDENRDGVNDFIDRKPGNPNDSASYARIYDPFAEQEHTNLLEIENRLEARRIADVTARQNRFDLDRMRLAQDAVHFFPSVGKFIIPDVTTWAEHAKIVLDNDSNLYFNPDKYPHFDKIINDALKLPALTDRDHPDFPKYRGLRTNLEVLRNDIIGQYLRDGSYDPGDEVYIPKIRATAIAIADGLTNDVWWKRPFTNHINRDVANVEAVGAAEMYKYLNNYQSKSKEWTSGLNELRKVLRMNDTHLGLLPLEETPFSPEGLSAPPIPSDDPTNGKNTVNPLQTLLMPEEKQLYADESRKLVSTCCGLNHVDTLNIPTKKDAVEKGRTIIRWLRSMELEDRDVASWLSAGTPPEQIAKADALSRLVNIYAGQLVATQHKSPELLSRPEVEDGSAAIGGIAAMIAEHALTILPPDSENYRDLEAAIEAMPKAQLDRSTQSLSLLLDHVEDGLATMSNQPMRSRSRTERLADATQRLQQHARQLREISSLEEPTREESVELGREILRKLRRLISGDKATSEALDAGRPDDKLANIERIEETVEIYKHLLTEALSINPGLANDQRIIDASDAVGGITHAISLMAAREIPSSAAAAQQISADITQMPEKWQQLDGQVVDRLLKTMEGGLEAAVNELEQEQAEQQQEEEMSLQAMESALNLDAGRRHRRRRQRSGLNARAMEKIRRDFMADDRAAGQGRFSEERMGNNNKTIKAEYPRLKDEDMAAIASLGDSLRSAGNAGTSLAMTQTTMDQPFAPDDKTAAERAIESITQSRRARTSSKRT